MQRELMDKAKVEMNTILERVYRIGYEQGLDDAWECARKILFDADLSGVLEEFDVDTHCGVISKYSASDAIAGVARCERKQHCKRCDDCINKGYCDYEVK